MSDDPTPETGEPHPESDRASAPAATDVVEIHDATGEAYVVPVSVPLLPVRDVVVYPGVTVPLTIGRRSSLAALEAAGHQGFLVIGTQREAATEDPLLHDLFETGTLVKVLRVVDARPNSKQALVMGLGRVHLGTLEASEPCLRVKLEFLPDRHHDADDDESPWHDAM